MVRQGERQTLLTLQPTMDAFIEELKKHAIVRLACDKAGISRPTAYQWRKTYKTFADRWDDALEDACDTLEAVARSRATRPVNPSDRLLVLLLKAHRPEKFGDKVQTEVTGKDGGPVEFTLAELVAKVAKSDDDESGTDSGSETKG